MVETTKKGNGMTVYIEYVLVENFVLDALLVTLSLHAAKAPIKTKNVAFSALLGGVFALLLPLCNGSAFLLGVLKISTGFLLCFVAYPHLKTKKGRGRYAIICFFFFCFSFAFAGALFAVFAIFYRQGNAYILTNIPVALILSAFLFFCLLSVYFIKKLYQKKRVFSHVYDCYIPYKQRSVHVLGFLDSGNRATSNGLPVCFISPAVAFDVWGNDLLVSPDFSSADEKLDSTAILQKNNEQGRNFSIEHPTKYTQINVTTVSGKKQLSALLGDVIIDYHGKRIQLQVYFAISTHIVFQEYALLLPGGIMDEETHCSNNL